MMKKAIGIVAALVLFAAGTMLIIGYVRNTEAQIAAEAAPTEILVVSQPVSSGETVQGLLRVEEYPARLVVDDMLRPSDTTTGLVASVDLLPGEPMMWSRLVEPTEIESGERTRAPIPDGMSAVTIPVTADRGVGGLLLPGMTVAVIGSYDVIVTDDDGGTQEVEVTHAIVQKALVVEVQATDPVPAEPAAQLVAADLPTGEVFVTLAVPIYDVERIVFTAEWGSIWLAEQGAHASEEARIQTMATVLDQVDPDEDPIEDVFSLGRPRTILPFASPLFEGAPEGLRPDDVPAADNGDDPTASPATVAGSSTGSGTESEGS